MVAVLRSSWALLLGMFLLMVGNSLQGSLIGVRGAIEGFDPALLSIVISAYFLGFLGGSRMAPDLIRSVGHVRVFAAMASLISAAFILYPALPDLIAWGVFRLIVGFCFSCVYVVAESWLNDSADNEHRGQALSLYMLVQMAGIITGQGVLNLGDPAGYVLFIVVSVLVSLSFAPILLSVSPAPVYEVTERMTLRRLFNTSPLGVYGSFAIGAIYSALFGMASVYGTERGFSLGEIAIFSGLIYFGGLCLQWPIGWVSDRVDRRRLIVAASAIGAGACLLAMLAEQSLFAIYAMMFVIGGMTNPLYALLIAHTNDFLQPREMPAASSGLVFVGGVGAIGGPLIVGQLMQFLGSWAFFLFILICMASIASYGLYRMTQRAATAVEDTSSYAPITPTATPVAVEVAQEYAIDQAAADEEREETDIVRDNETTNT
ncbi:MAG: MFS transporter [Pseudomonadota bacterium]